MLFDTAKLVHLACIEAILPIDKTLYNEQKTIDKAIDKSLFHLIRGEFVPFHRSIGCCRPTIEALPSILLSRFLSFDFSSPWRAGV